ncbi:MAG: hypothetical protein CMM01_10005 [Rhodopirellula sp.]|nr:hypothetical protein [Rhodopirellula sp.]OUX51341.1 MAG: hypothetical protein CBE43_03645 [Rhodopirellula sp. TMED283]
MIAGANNEPDNLKLILDWILAKIGCDVPIHSTAFHPDFPNAECFSPSLEASASVNESVLRADWNAF